MSTPMSIHLCVHMHTCVYIHTFMYTCVCVDVHRELYVYVDSCDVHTLQHKITNTHLQNVQSWQQMRGEPFGGCWWLLPIGLPLATCPNLKTKCEGGLLVFACHVLTICYVFIIENNIRGEPFGGCWWLPPNLLTICYICRFGNKMRGADCWRLPFNSWNIC